MNELATAKVETFDCRQAFAETLIELAKSDPRIVAVCNDSVGSSNLIGFQKLFPDHGGQARLDEKLRRFDEGFETGKPEACELQSLS